MSRMMQAATSAPLIERSIERATGIVYNITGGRDLTLQEVNRSAPTNTSNFPTSCILCPISYMTYIGRHEIL